MRTTPRTSEVPRKSSYAVEEIVNERPTEYLKKSSKSSKSNILSEQSYEAPNFPSRRNSAAATQPRTDTPELSESTENLVGNSIIPDIPVSPSSPSPELLEDQPLDTTLKTNTLDLPSEATPEEIKDITKTVPQISSTTKSTIDSPRSQNNFNGNRRNNGRSRVGNNVADNPVTSRVPESTRGRVRTRAPKKIGESFVPNSVPTRTVDRSSRRKPAQTPQPLSAVATQSDFQFRPAKRIDPLASERGSIDLSASRTRDVRRRTATPTTTTTTITVDQQSRRSSFRKKNGNPSSVQTFPSRNSVREKETPTIIDEQKLEVLPLFESEPKTVRPASKSRTRERTSRKIETTTRASSRTSRSRGRARNSVIPEETFLTSATETDVTFTKPDFPSIVSVSVNVETRTESSFKRRPASKKPQVKESVVSEITEVTSKRTIPRRRNNSENSVLGKSKTDSQKNKIREKIVAFRGHRKSEVKLSAIKKSKGGSSDEIDESDNYPEPFKALIQAKKSQVCSRNCFKTSELNSGVILTTLKLEQEQ